MHRPRSSWPKGGEGISQGRNMHRMTKGAALAALKVVTSSTQQVWEPVLLAISRDYLVSAIDGGHFSLPWLILPAGVAFAWQ